MKILGRFLLYSNGSRRYLDLVLSDNLVFVAFCTSEYTFRKWQSDLIEEDRDQYCVDRYP